MRRTAAVAGLIFVLLSTVPASAATVQRVILVWADGTSLADWTSEETPHLHDLLATSSIAIMSTRTARERTEARAMRASAAVTLGAGMRGAGEPGTGRAVPVRGVRPGILGEALARASVRVEILGDADDASARDRSAVAIVEPFDGTQTPRRVPSAADAETPGGLRADIAGLARAIRRSDAGLIVVDPGDTARAQAAAGLDAERAATLVRPAMERLDRLVGRIRSSLRPGDVLVVAAGAPPVEHQRLGLRLAPVAIAGEGFPPALLSSPTTRREGIITLFDLTPTIAGLLDAPLPGGMDGRAVEVHPRADAPAALERFSGDVMHSALARFPFTRRALYVAMGVVALGTAMFLAGVGRARGGRLVPRGSRDLVGLLCVVAAALPLGIYVEGGFPTSGVLSGALAVLTFAIVLAAGSRAVLGTARASAFVALATVGVVVVDVASGTPLGHKSALGFQVAIGGRFFGVDDGVLGVVVGAALIGFAMVLDTARAVRGWRIAAAAAFAMSVVVLSAPGLGSKFGVPFTAIPAFGVFAILVGGSRVRFRQVALIAAVTGIVAAAFVVADRLGVAPATHVGRAFGGESDILAVLERKVTATWRISTTTLWSVATLAFGAALLAPVLARRAAFERGMWGRPHLRAAVWACAVGAVAGIVANDGGVITSAPLLLYAACATTLVLAEGA